MSFGKLGEDIILIGVTPPVLPKNVDYKPVISPKNQKSIVGAVITLDSRGSFSPNPDPIDYYWQFTVVPIGSQVAKYGFITHEPDASVVTFAPDITGFYRISLTMADKNFVSNTVEAEVYIQVTMVPHNQGVVPDAKFLWNFLSDFWTTVKGRDKIESIWGSSLQIIASNLLDLYQIDYNKSIRDTQDYFQRKWLDYNPRLDLDDCSFILTDEQAGFSAQSVLLGVSPQPPLVDTIRVLATSANFMKTAYGQVIKPGKLITFANNSYRQLRGSTGSLLGTDYSLFIAEEKNIPSNLSDFWRVASTLTSPTINFEEQGVSIGDILAVEIAKIGTELKSTLKLQILGVYKNSISFSWNRAIVVPGTPTGGLTFDDQVALANDLKIGTIGKAVDGSTFYLGDAQSVVQRISTIDFKRQHYEKVLTSSSIISVGPFSITAKPIYVIRNTKVPIAKEIVSVPTLQECIQQPTIQTIDGKLAKVIDDRVYSITDRPKFLFENLDYLIDDQSSIKGTANIVSGNAILEVPFGDLIDRKIAERDTLIIDVGLNKGSYIIIKVVDPTHIEVTPIPQATQANAKFRLLRRVPGKFIRFANGSFTPRKIAPEQLWGEVTYLDNSKAIEDNFGVLIGLTKEQLDRLQISPPYKAATAGLMFSYANGPTINNLRLGAQILLGLPFTYHRGIILDINRVYRTLENGAPLFGRFLVAEIDRYGKRTGLTNIYLYPRGKQVFNIITGKWEDQDPDFSGIAINPKTGVEYEIGDIVEQFAILSKGVEVEDYLIKGSWYDTILSQADISFVLRKYHAAYLRANVDVFSTEDLDFVVDFLRKTKPHYVHLAVAALKAFEDTVNITDDLWFKATYSFADSLGISLPAAAKFDAQYNGPNYISVDGIIYCRYIYGDDLTTDFNTSLVSSAGGGFITARAGEFHDSPFLRAGDLLVISESPNSGKYPVVTVVNDTVLNVNLNGGKFKSHQNQRFAVFRPITNPIYRGTIQVTNLSATITLPSGGKFSAGIAPGDELCFDDNSFPSKKYKVARIDDTAITVDALIEELSGNYNVTISRRQLLTKYLHATKTDTPFTATTVNGTPWITFGTPSLWQQGFFEARDVIYIDGHPPYTIIDFDPPTRAAYVTPTPLINDAAVPAKVWRTWLPETSFSIDIVDRLITDRFHITIQEPTASAVTSAGDRWITFNGADSLQFLNIKVHDFVRFDDAPNNVHDIGYGPGIFPIADIDWAMNRALVTENVLLTAAQNHYSFIRLIDI